jgi:hypothetical protein
LKVLLANGTIDAGLSLRSSGRPAVVPRGNVSGATARNPGSRLPPRAGLVITDITDGAGKQRPIMSGKLVLDHFELNKAFNLPLKLLVSP